MAPTRTSATASKAAAAAAAKSATSQASPATPVATQSSTEAASAKRGRGRPRSSQAGGKTKRTSNAMSVTTSNIGAALALRDPVSTIMEPGLGINPTPVSRAAAPTATVLATRNSELEAEARKLQDELAKAHAENIKLAKYKQLSTQINATAINLVVRPSGEFGKNGLVLREELGFEGSEKKQKWNAFLRGMRKCACEAQLDFSRNYHQQSIVRLAQAFTAAKDRFPFLKKFKNDWASREVFKNILANRRRYERKIDDKENMEPEGSMDIDGEPVSANDVTRNDGMEVD